MHMYLGYATLQLQRNFTVYHDVETYSAGTFELFFGLVYMLLAACGRWFLQQTARSLQFSCRRSNCTYTY